MRNNITKPKMVEQQSVHIKWHILDLIIHVADYFQSDNGILPSSSLSFIEWLPKPPSSLQIWDRINRRMYEFHSELAPCPQHGRLGGSPVVLIHHFHPPSKAGKGRSSRDTLPPTVVIHDPSSSLYSVRLPPVNEDRISPSGRIALKKLREEVYFSFK